ncbi:hypothetical protein TRICI_004451 [Trichomonascus ciferrii]|uniref:Uncharacterized protein n=1 Tax=Trichomonascus ciferrii TaxID=44093 RepID=A0A642V0W8_9ASCO|nr:hypothetical protein TRICI_004451 [Trichomonascus ciferrii]
MHMDLNLEVEQAKERFEKDREKGKYQHVHRKKRQKVVGKNKGVRDRGLTDTKDMEGVRESNLERKRELYDQLKSGKVPRGYNDKDLLLQVDYQSSGDESEDEMIEIVDEFGRSRQVKRNEYYNGPVERPKELVYGDLVQHEAVQFNDLNSPGKQNLEEAEDVHYDSRWEVRDKGVGFYQFSQSEDERRRQMAELKHIREETFENVATKDSVMEKRKTYHNERKMKILTLREKSIKRAEAKVASKS